MRRPTDRGVSRRDVLRAGTQAGAALLLSRRVVGQDKPSLIAAIGTPEPDAVAFVEPELREARDGLLDTSLHARFAHNTIAGRPIYSRTFEGKLTGPTLKFRPGDVVRVLYVNELPPEPTTGAGHMGMAPGLNPTNLHTHGTRPKAVFSYNKGNFFGLLTFDTTKADPELTFQCVTIEGESVYSMTLKRSQLEVK